MIRFKLPSARTRFTTQGLPFGEVYSLARELREAPPIRAAPRSPVCVAGDDKVALSAAVLASLSGGPPLLLPHGNSPQVLHQLHNATGCSLVLAGSNIPLPEGMERIAVRARGTGRSAPRFTLGSDDWLLSLFTGGSTARPRLWRKTPRNLVGEAAALVRRYRITPDDVVLSCVPPVHIYGLLFGLLAPLLSGARLVLETPFLPAEIRRALAQEKATVLVGSPVHYRALAASPLSAPHLRWAFSSGGMLEEADAAHFTRQTGQGVLEVYGSTETGGVATRCRANGESLWTPLPPVRVAVRGERLRVRSPYLSPDLPRGAGGFFTTGDRALIKPGGRFELLGRVDGIVKVGGQRVDLAEVELALKSAAGVKDALALAIPTTTGRGSELVSLVVYQGKPEALRARCNRLLDPPARPRRIVRVKRIPLTPAGKTDREACLALLESSG